MILNTEPMKQLNFVIALITSDNDYQQEQARAAEEAAHRLNVNFHIVYAESDAITQSQQLLKFIQSPPGLRPDAIVFEAVSATGLPHVARAAVDAGIAWGVMNCNPDYITELRNHSRVPVCAITSDHEEIGRIQGRQFEAMLPGGGSVLYVQGPSHSPAAQQRTFGVHETKPTNIDIKMIRGNWTEASGYQAVSAWLRLSTSHNSVVDIIGSQNDAMAIGARKAFEELTTGEERERWLRLPYTGCDGVPKTGQAWVQKGLLTATVVVPPNTDVAVKALAESIDRGSQPPARIVTELRSFPPLEKLPKKKPAA